MKNKSLSKNTVFYLIYNVLNVIFPFISGIYVTRVLIPNDIGLIEGIRNFVQYFVIFSFLGIPTYGLREVSKLRQDKEKLNVLYSELMIINFISTIFFCIIYLILIFNIPRFNINLNLYLILGGSLLLNIFNNSWLYEGLEEFKYISLRNLFFKIVSFIALVIFVKNSSDVYIYAFVTMLSTVGIYLLNMVNSNKFVKFTFKNINLKKHIKPIIYLVVVNLAIEIYTLLDVSMLSVLTDNETVAYYSYGMKIYKILLNIVNTFTLVLVPRIAFYYKEKRIDEFNQLVTMVLKIVLIITLPMIVGIMFTSKNLLTIIYGNNYIRSAYVLNILACILLLSPVGYLLGSRVLLVTDNEKKMTIPVIVGAISNMIGNFILIPYIAEIGAAIASVFSEFLVMFTYILLGKKYFKIINFKITIKKICISMFLLIMFLLFTANLKVEGLFKTCIQIIGSILIYFGALLTLKESIVYDFFEKKIMMGVKKWLKRD